MPFTCSGCGAPQVWTASQQKWWYEGAKGYAYSTAKHCCGGKLVIIASIEDPEVIAKILAHQAQTNPDRYQPELPLEARAPPGQSSLI